MWRFGGRGDGHARIGRTGASGGTVVVLSRATGPMTAPPQFSQLRAYWEALRDGDALPRRADIDPRGIADILEQTMLIERIAPGQARIRLAGMMLCDLLGMELRGMPLSALILPQTRDRMAEVLEQVFAGPAIGVFGFEAERGLTRPALSAELLLLPVTGRSGASDRAIGCLVTTGKIGRAPRRLALARANLLPVPGLGAAGPAPTIPQGAVPGFAEPPAPFAGEPQHRPPTHGHLRLVSTRD